MPLIYRRDLDRPLTFEEMDGNLEYLDRYAEDVEIVVEHIDEISTVATSINGVNAVAGSLPSVITASLHVDNIDTVADDVTNIDTVAGISSEVTAVAGVATEIAAVYADLANIDSVAGDLTNIDALAAVSTDISTVASIEADVTTVSGISSDVSTLSAISDDILTVSSINENVTTVANNSANITTVATNIAAILAAQGYAEDAADSAGEAAASALEALGYLNSTEGVYLNFDERYLGAKATAPIVDNQGNPLITGAIYFDTTIGFMYVYTGSAWQSIAAAGGVDSVNGQTGDVVLDYEDVGAYSTSQVDTLLSAKADDSAVVHDTGAESVAGVKTFTDGVIASSVQLSGGTGTQGTMSWNADEETVDLIQDGATLQLGQELQVHCRNNTASTIGNATVVMATGTIGMSGRITIAPWDGTTDIKYVLGVSTEVIEAGTDGKVTTFGKVRDVDTGAISGTLTTGVIYAKTDGTGGLTYTKPATNALPLAFLVSEESAGPANNGTIMVRVTPVAETTLDHAETAYGWGNHASAGYATAANLSAHTGNTSNPHSVTATQVGLGNVTNESKATMFTSPTFTGNAVLGTPASGDFSTGAFTWPTFNQSTSGNAATATSATNASNVPWSGVSSKPTTLSGYGITDAQPASTAITTSNIGSQSVSYATSAGNADTLDGSHASAFQATLVSGTNIKTVGGSSLLGSGDVAVSGFPAGTVMLFYQSAAPTGWTQVTTLNDYALRLVSGAGGTTAGTTAFSTIFANQTPTFTGSIGTLAGGAITLSTAQMPSHTHTSAVRSSEGYDVGFSSMPYKYAGNGNTGATGGGGSHSHSISGAPGGTVGEVTLNVRYANIIICSRN